MFDPSASNQNIAPSQSGGDHKGSGFDAVGHDREVHGLQFIDPLNGDSVTAGALDMGAHGNQSIGEIYDFGLTGSVFQHRGALGQHRGHHQVFSAADGGEI